MQDQVRWCSGDPMRVCGLSEATFACRFGECDAWVACVVLQVLRTLKEGLKCVSFQENCSKPFASLTVRPSP
eukprot:2699281-Rhodomonas_salina.1